MSDLQNSIESKYFDGDYEELPADEKLDMVGYELLRIEDEIDELKERQHDLETLYDLLKEWEA